jgi:hypothetical protein
MDARRRELRPSINNQRIHTMNTEELRALLKDDDKWHAVENHIGQQIDRALQAERKESSKTLAAMTVLRDELSKRLDERAKNQDEITAKAKKVAGALVQTIEKPTDDQAGLIEQLARIIAAADDPARAKKLEEAAALREKADALEAEAGK